MKKNFIFSCFMALFFTVSFAQLSKPVTQNTLSKAEKKAGWKLLFDGHSLNHWRGFTNSSAPSNWTIEDGALTMSRLNSKTAEDLVTKNEYESFELSLEWKISERGNSGVMFHVSIEPLYKYSSETGPEMQVLDNDKHPDGKGAGGKHRAGTAYDLYPATAEVVKPVGEYNQVRLVVNNKHVEHWLNGVKIVEYDLLSPEWEQRVAQSKFAKTPQYGRLGKGHISLQDHGDRVWYRNIKIKKL